MTNTIRNDRDCARALEKARDLIRRAFAAKARANHRHPSTATAEKERLKAEEYIDRADALFDAIDEYLDPPIFGDED